MCQSLCRRHEGRLRALSFSPLRPQRRSVWGYANEVGSALAAAVRQARLPKVVALSSIGAQHATGTGVIATLNSLEKHSRRGSAHSTTFLRPGYFVESWGEVAPAAMADGVLPSFSNPTRVPMVEHDDVGRTAAGPARRRLHRQAGRRTARPAGLERERCRGRLRQGLGRPVATAFVPPEARAAVLAEAGVPREVADALLGMYDGIASGRLDTEAGTEQRRGSVALADAVARMVRSMESNAGGLAA